LHNFDNNLRVVCPFRQTANYFTLQLGRSHAVNRNTTDERYRHRSICAYDLLQDGSVLSA
jgi:hypothetical protein